MEPGNADLRIERPQYVLVVPGTGLPGIEHFLGRVPVPAASEVFAGALRVAAIQPPLVRRAPEGVRVGEVVVRRHVLDDPRGAPVQVRRDAHRAQPVGGAVVVEEAEEGRLFSVGAVVGHGAVNEGAGAPAVAEECAARRLARFSLLGIGGIAGV